MALGGISSKTDADIVHGGSLYLTAVTSLDKQKPAEAENNKLVNSDKMETLPDNARHQKKHATKTNTVAVEAKSKKLRKKRKRQDGEAQPRSETKRGTKDVDDIGLHNNEGESDTKRKRRKKKKAKRTNNGSHSLAPKSYNWDQDGEDESLENVERLEGFVYEGVLLLRDLDRDVIYSSERNPNGDLVEVGKWCAHGKHEFDTYEWKLPNLPRTKDPLKFRVTDPADHCETNIRAYMDIKDALETIAGLTPGIERPADIRVWDPFFCTGRMRTHMISIGFPNVRNENEDFYEVKHNPPSHDILLTNPPYSRDHIPRLLEYCTQLDSPCFLLLPSWVGKKDYFSRFDNQDSRYFFITPKSGRYTYHNPGLDGAKVGRTAPFQSFWYVSAKSHRSEMLRKLATFQNKEETTWELYKSINRVPERFFDAQDGW